MIANKEQCNLWHPHKWEKTPSNANNPIGDEGTLRVCLNCGAKQLRLFYNGLDYPKWRWQPITDEQYAALKTLDNKEEYDRTINIIAWNNSRESQALELKFRAGQK